MASKVSKICTAYDGLERFFPKEKIVLTGNPVRSEMVAIDGKKTEALNFFQLDANKKTILVIGGSLGAKTLNESIIEQLDAVQSEEVQILWQCGKFYYAKLQANEAIRAAKNIHLNEFIQRMDLAYAAADVIISRAGAISVSELCLIAKPCILVPSPNVAEDHQTKNAMALVNKGAALLIKDDVARQELIPATLDLLKQADKQEDLIQNIKQLALPKATEDIVNEIEKIVKR